MANKNVSPTYFVAHTNPEIFDVTPRPGGFAKIDIVPKRSGLKEWSAEEADNASRTSTRRSRLSGLQDMKSIKEKKMSSSATGPSKKSLLTITSADNRPKPLDMDSCPREFKVKKVIATVPWSMEFDEYLEPTEESKRIPDPFQDSVDMLAMSISVIMLLARGYDKISDTNFKWIVSYLDCIKDEFGQTPPNVQGILNHITQVTGGKITSFLDEGDLEPSELTDKKTTVKIAEETPQ